MTSESVLARHHQLDALRAFAMVLGIVLHGLLPFIDVPIWPARDVHQDLAEYGFHAIHGFRLPLFFLVSGFFTAMLWRRRGMRSLVRHRVKRILVPLVVGTILTWPLLIAVGLWGAKTKAELAKRETAPTLSQAAKTGNLEAIREHAARGIDINRRDGMGATPMVSAALLGQSETIDLLVSLGADVASETIDGSTALHAAALFGRVEAVELLLALDADSQVRNRQGATPLDNARVDWSFVQFVAGAMSMSVDKVGMQRDRARVVALLEEAQMANAEQPKSVWDSIVIFFYVGSIIPVFHHLWFLYYLLWLLVGFVIVAMVVRKASWLRFPTWLTSVPGCLLWWIPLTVMPQLVMRQSFGPDTSPGLLPWPPKLLYYAIFFAFGALCYGRDGAIERAGRRWILYFLLAIPALIFGVQSFAKYGAPLSSTHLVTTVTSVIYAWLMIFGCLGLFHRFFAKESPRIRYLSDASYWLYLAHLPLIVALQVWVSPWSLPSLLKLTFVCTLTIGILMVIYAYVVRYSFIGALLNGRRLRPGQ